LSKVRVRVEFGGIGSEIWLPFHGFLGPTLLGAHLSSLFVERDQKLSYASSQGGSFCVLLTMRYVLLMTRHVLLTTKYPNINAPVKLQLSQILSYQIWSG
jgi:hypothetical protein